MSRRVICAYCGKTVRLNMFDGARMHDTPEGLPCKGGKVPARKHEYLVSVATGAPLKPAPVKRGPPAGIFDAPWALA